MSDKQGVPPCKGCPFLRSNHGKKTKGGFYTIKNLKRLRAGIRNGTDGKLMICHATDPTAHETGSPANPQPGQIKAGNERVCLGALFLYKREEKLLNEAGGLREYTKHPCAAKPPMTRWGFAAVINAVLNSKLSQAMGGRSMEILMPDMTADVGLPWEDTT
jgi:hypothetical protein